VSCFSRVLAQDVSARGLPTELLVDLHLSIDPEEEVITIETIKIEKGRLPVYSQSTSATTATMG
jgi:hypothetical protein